MGTLSTDPEPRRTWSFSRKRSTRKRIFQIGAPGTRWQQKHHLLEFRRLMLVRQKMRGRHLELPTLDPSSDENDAVFFGDNFLVDYKTYLLNAVRTVLGRQVGAEKSRLSAISTCWFSMLY